MQLRDLRISTKIMGGFFLVVVILAAAILYQLSSLSTLARLQDEGAGRAVRASRGQSDPGSAPAHLRNRLQVQPERHAQDHHAFVRSLMRLLDDQD